MAIVIASMMVIVFAAVGVLVFVGALHLASTSPRFRAKLRRFIFTAVARMYAARRAASYKLAPMVARVEARPRSRAATPAPPPIAEMESAGQQ